MSEANPRATDCPSCCRHQMLTAERSPLETPGNESSPPVVSVVMPCLNEERTVVSCVKMALNGIRDLGIQGEVIVCDNGSIDDSVVLARQAGARVVCCRQRGYGYAVRYGVEGSLGKWIVMGDADESYDFTRLRPFIELLSAGADVVIGNRFLGGIARGAMPWKNRYIGNPVLTEIVNALFRTGVGDSLCGLRAFSRDAFQFMGLECGGMEFAIEMLVKASLHRLSISEVPVSLKRDGRNRPPHLAPWSDGLRTLRYMLNSSPLNPFHSAIRALWAVTKVPTSGFSSARSALMCRYRT